MGLKYWCTEALVSILHVGDQTRVVAPGLNETRVRVRQHVWRQSSPFKDSSAFPCIGEGPRKGGPKIARLTQYLSVNRGRLDTILTRSKETETDK